MQLTFFSLNETFAGEKIRRSFFIFPGCAAKKLSHKIFFPFYTKVMFHQVDFSNPSALHEVLEYIVIAEKLETKNVSVCKIVEKW